jgi:hypothetical protein
VKQRLDNVDEFSEAARLLLDLARKEQTRRGHDLLIKKSQNSYFNLKTPRQKKKKNKTKG